MKVNQCVIKQKAYHSNKVKVRFLTIWKLHLERLKKGVCEDWFIAYWESIQNVSDSWAYTLSHCTLYWCNDNFYLSFFTGIAHIWALRQGVQILIQKQKNFWLNFCLNKEWPKLLCGLDIDHRRRQTIPMWNCSGEKRNSSRHHCMSGVCGIEVQV